MAKALLKKPPRHRDYSNLNSNISALSSPVGQGTHLWILSLLSGYFATSIMRLILFKCLPPSLYSYGKGRLNMIPHHIRANKRGKGVCYHCPLEGLVAFCPEDPEVLNCKACAPVNKQHRLA